MDSEMKYVARVIKEVEKDRDSRILAALARDRIMLGLNYVAPRFAWNGPGLFSAFPFPGTKN
jgi:hypothetical protein